ncbi:MAG: hypothetical protein EZS28_018015 [Streblomastix strix]|uniref:Uncharacterized protein n=1 Tax=Streblomastix strix TaxID=222440 RepID=A0A5J4VVI9_9EUKA|nr:MAG: hypothetical protein EZS28_018015 [Streblomastix strix]
MFLVVPVNLVPHILCSYIPQAIEYQVAQRVGGEDGIDPTFHTPSLSVGSVLHPVNTKLSQFALFFIILIPQSNIVLLGSIVNYPIA